MPIGPLVDIVLSAAGAFFISGAVIFPLLHPYYLPRVVLSLGVVGLLNGCESIVRLGHVTTCGALSGNCEEHSVRAVALVLWPVLFILLRWRSRRRQEADASARSE